MLCARMQCNAVCTMPSLPSLLLRLCAYSSNKAGFSPESRSISVQPNFHGDTISLQDLNPGEVFPPGAIVLTVVTYIGASVSVLCLLVTVVTYSAAK